MQATVFLIGDLGSSEVIIGLLGLSFLVGWFILLREAKRLSQRMTPQQRTNELLEQVIHELKAARLPSAGTLNPPQEASPAAPTVPASPVG